MSSQTVTNYFLDSVAATIMRWLFTVLAFYYIRSFDRNRVLIAGIFVTVCEKKAEEKQRKTRVLGRISKKMS